MPIELPILSEESLSSIAYKQLGDFSKWREIAELNNLNPLQSLNIGSTLQVPNKDEILKQAEPILSQVAAGINGAESLIQTTIAQATEQLSAYTQVAQLALAEVNGIIGEAESQLSQVTQVLGGRDYGKNIVRLVDWLLQ